MRGLVVFLLIVGIGACGKSKESVGPGDDELVGIWVNEQSTLVLREDGTFRLKGIELLYDVMGDHVFEGSWNTEGRIKLVLTIDRVNGESVESADESVNYSVFDDILTFVSDNGTFEYERR